jgi:hypothetical protein
MNQIRRVGNFQPQDSPIDYDSFICALGYESRAIHAADKMALAAANKVAVGFDYHHSGQLAYNVDWFKSRGFLDWTEDGRENADSPFRSDEQFDRLVKSMIERLVADAPERPLRVCIDISCFSMIRLAFLLEAIVQSSSKYCIFVDFVYSSGRGYEGHREPSQIETAGPVTERYAGWTVEPDLPVHAIFGLGLEYEKAVGAIELLNPSDAFAFATLGTSAALDKHITDANRLFFPLIDPPKRFAFSIDRPMAVYHRLRSLTLGILRQARPVIVPMGPKIFGLAALLIAESFVPRISVWRISTGRSGEPLDICATGPIHGYTVEFAPIN